MNEPALDPQTEAELITLLNELKTNGEKWKAALEQGEAMFQRHREQRNKSKEGLLNKFGRKTKKSE